MLRFEAKGLELPRTSSDNRKCGLSCRSRTFHGYNYAGYVSGFLLILPNCTNARRQCETFLTALSPIRWQHRFPSRGPSEQLEDHHPSRSTPELHHPWKIHRRIDTRERPPAAAVTLSFACAIASVSLPTCTTCTCSATYGRRL